MRSDAETDGKSEPPPPKTISNYHKLTRQYRLLEATKPVILAKIESLKNAEICARSEQIGALEFDAELEISMNILKQQEKLYEVELIEKSSEISQCLGRIVEKKEFLRVLELQMEILELKYELLELESIKEFGKFLKIAVDKLKEQGVFQYFRNFENFEFFEGEEKLLRLELKRHRLELEESQLIQKKNELKTENFWKIQKKLAALLGDVIRWNIAKVERELERFGKELEQEKPDVEPFVLVRKIADSKRKVLEFMEEHDVESHPEKYGKLKSLWERVIPCSIQVTSWEMEKLVRNSEQKNLEPEQMEAEPEKEQEMEQNEHNEQNKKNEPEPEKEPEKEQNEHNKKNEHNEHNEPEPAQNAPKKSGSRELVKIQLSEFGQKIFDNFPPERTRSVKRKHYDKNYCEEPEQTKKKLARGGARRGEKWEAAKLAKKREKMAHDEPSTSGEEQSHKKKKKIQKNPEKEPKQEVIVKEEEEDED